MVALFREESILIFVFESSNASSALRIGKHFSVLRSVLREAFFQLILHKRHCNQHSSAHSECGSDSDEQRMAFLDNGSQ